MTPDQLMITRYKVVAEYPFMSEKLGSILTFDNAFDSNIAGRYPHLFRKLEWWEERQLRHIPKYLLIRDEKRVIRVSKMRKEFGDGDIYVTFPGGHASIVHFLPSTVEQYLSQQNNE